MNARVAAVIQARMGSNRLPGKVLLPLGSHSILAWVVRAARSAAQVDDIVVATTENAADDRVLDACLKLGVDVVRGSEDDVLSRFIVALNATSADAVVRLTADCPLLDPALIDQVISIWRADPSLEYVSTTLIRTFPRGLDVELASRSALKAAAAEAVGSDRIHVTSHLYHESSSFRRVGIVAAPSNADLRVTLDVDEDYSLLNGVVGALGEGPHRWQDVVRVLRESPELRKLNAAVQQKKIEEG